jgi:23S rRNA (cytidine1920-2'-O)/16S rRNA (cytidine1409-2'-O)-methyltransferase
LKKRADLLLVDKKITDSRTKAQAMIMAGQISINGKKVLKSGETYEEDVNIHVTKLHPQWVSRGALKLCHAIQNFNIEIANLVCLDLGASTGGFTEVLLSKNVKKIYAVDVGSNQLHEKLKKDSRIVNLSKTNARYLNKDIIHDIIDIIVCDVSFISMKKVIQPSLQFLDEENGVVIGLIKPQFESKKVR